MRDSWDNLTLKQAEEVSAFLISEPYILDYCDCCDYEGDYATEIHLMKVTSTEIITCDWNPEHYSIRVTVDVLAKIPYLKDGPDISSPLPLKSQKQQIISMNYNWAYNKEEKKLAPLFTIIPYDIYGELNLNSGTCRKLIDFPSPKHIKNGIKKDFNSLRIPNSSATSFGDFPVKHRLTPINLNSLS